jgi:hypothetical protein
MQQPPADADNSQSSIFASGSSRRSTRKSPFPAKLHFGMKACAIGHTTAADIRSFFCRGNYRAVGHLFELTNHIAGMDI